MNNRLTLNPLGITRCRAPTWLDNACQVHSWYFRSFLWLVVQYFCQKDNRHQARGFFFKKHFVVKKNYKDSMNWSLRVYLHWLFAALVLLWNFKSNSLLVHKALCLVYFTSLLTFLLISTHFPLNHLAKSRTSGEFRLYSDELDGLDEVCHRTLI